LIFFFLVAGIRTPDLTYIMHCPYQLSYALSIPTELSSRGQLFVDLN
jgi:hypothetical protein